MRKFSMLLLPGLMTLFCCWATTLQTYAIGTRPHRTTKGEIVAVDTNSRTFTLIVGKLRIAMAYHDKTQFIESGHVVQPEAIAEEKKAKVRFVENETGKLTAIRVDLKPADCPTFWMWVVLVTVGSMHGEDNPSL